MGDQQLSPSPIDLVSVGRGVNSSFYPTAAADQPQQLLGKTDDEEGRMPFPAAAAASRASPLTTAVARSLFPSTKESRPSSASQAPVESGGGGGGDQRPLSGYASDDQLNQSSLSSLSSSSDVVVAGVATTTTTMGNDGDVVASLGSVITSFGLMQVGGSGSPNGDRQLLFSSNSNHQNLSPAIYQLLAQSQLPVHKWPMTQQQQQQQTAVSSFCSTNFQNGLLFNNLQPGHGWNGNLQGNLHSHCNDFNALWGQNHQSRKANSLPSNIADAAILSKLQPKSPFAKNFQQSATSVRTGKMISDESGGVNQLNPDAEILKLSGVNASILEVSGSSQSQDRLKPFPNWTFTGQQASKRGMSPYGLLDHFHLLENGSLDQVVPNLAQLSGVSPNNLSPLRMEHYSRKVFVGGLPPDIDEEEITAAFRRFGPLIVDWPHKAESKSYFPPKGYCFLLFQDELSVQTLIDTCMNEDGKLFWFVSSPTMKDKMVQIRPWNLADSDFVMDGSQPLDPRKTIFVGGVPRPLKAIELAVIVERLYGGVCYAGIDTDPELKYPKGAGRVAFSSQQSYIAAISARFVQLQHGEIDKRVEVKPYVLDDQLCDECQGVHCGGRFAPFFCANVACLQYYCEHCWSQIHSRPGREFHKPLVKEGSDRPRSLPFRWC